MRKVLVVDDDHDILTVVEIVLNMHNFKVQVLSKPDEINNTIKSFFPDLILLDVALGSVDGRDICKELKQSNETKHIPVLLFSAHYDLINDIHECFADGLITKPFETLTLVDSINKAMA